MPQNITKLNSSSQNRLLITIHCKPNNLVNKINSTIKELHRHSLIIKTFDYKLINKNTYQFNFQLQPQSVIEDFYYAIDCLRPNIKDLDNTKSIESETYTTTITIINKLNKTLKNHESEFNNADFIQSLQLANPGQIAGRVIYRLQHKYYSKSDLQQIKKIYYSNHEDSWLKVKIYYLISQTLNEYFANDDCPLNIHDTHQIHIIIIGSLINKVKSEISTLTNNQ